MIKKFVVWGLGFEVVQVDEKLVGFLVSGLLFLVLTAQCSLMMSVIDY